MSLNKLTSTLRGRLAWWYFWSVGTIFLLFTIAISLLFSFTLQDQIDRHIQTTLKEAKQIVQNYQGDELKELIKNLIGAQGMTIVVIAPDGAPILETNTPDTALITEHQLQKIILHQRLYETEPMSFTENQIRFAAVPAQVRAGKGVVAVGYSTKILYATFYRVFLMVVGSLVLLVLPTTYLGYITLKKYLTPLEEIAYYAKSISSTSLSQRIRLKNSSQELTTIQQALNEMLDKLERIIEGEREFFADAAHTLKTPLAVLKAQIENTKLGKATKSELATTIDQANEVIQDLLYLAKISGEKRISEVNVSLLMTKLAELAKTLGSINQIKVSAKIQPNLRAKTDEKMLSRALSNVVENAIIYTKPGGKVELSLKQRGNKLIIIISDTGIGIEKKEMSKIFRRFYHGQNGNHQGSGLGLAITKVAIESLEGTIAISSKKNRGTTATIKL